MRRTGGSRNFGQSGNRRMNQNRMRQPERLQGRHSRDGGEGSYKIEDNDSRYAQGHSGGFEDYGQWNDREGPDSFERGISEKSRESQDKGVYSTIAEDDIRSELDYRSNESGTGRYGRGSDLMDEDHRWRLTEGERFSGNRERGNEGSSWRTRGNIGGRRRRRVIYD